MRWQDVGGLECSVARALSVCGDRWTLLILRDAFLGTRRFDAFQAQLCITRHRLADRLTKLVGYGVLRKERYQERPPRDEYRLTDKGRDLYGVVVMLAAWGDRWMAGADGPPVVRVHRDCGHVATLRLACEHCGAPVTARDMEARPGPGVRRSARPTGIASTTRGRRRTARRRAVAGAAGERGRGGAR
jgi:DNA-binding HxlR family transcriptional regulator